MKNKPLLFLLSVCGLLAISARGENPPAKVIFEQYMNQAQTFADTIRVKKHICILIIQAIMWATRYGSKHMSLLPKNKFSVQSAVLCMWNW